jgi:hypothetical protein
MNWLERQAAKVAGGQLERRFPEMKTRLAAISEMLSQPGVKRGVAAIAGIATIVCSHAQAMLGELCAQGLMVGSACGVNLGWIGSTIDSLADVLTSGVVTGGLSASTLIMGAWGWWAAYVKAHAKVTSGQ